HLHLVLTHHSLLFFYNAPPPSDTYTLSLHDALPICPDSRGSRTGVRARESRTLQFGRPCPVARTAGGPRRCPRRVVLRRGGPVRSEEHTSELQSRSDLVCRLLLEKKKKPLESMSMII